MNLARLDPRVKLFLLAGLSAAALAAPQLAALPALLVVVLLVLLGGRVKPSEIWMKLRGIFGLIVSLFLLQCLFNRSGDALLSVSGFGLVTDLGLRTAVFVSLRLLIIVLSALIVSTGEARDYLLSLTSLKVPYEIAFMVLAALRFLPMLREEARDVFCAAQMRGLQIKKAGLKKQLSAYLGLTIPVVAGAIHRAESLSIAMEARGFRVYPKRTSMSALRMRKADWIYLAAFCLAIAAVFLFLFVSQ